MAIYKWEADSTTATTYKLFVKEDEDAQFGTDPAATITGLKAGLVTEENQSSITDVTIGTDSPIVITVAAGALDTPTAGAKVSLTGSGYTLKISDTKYGATISPEAVTVSNGTATLTGTLSAGWEETSNTTLTYKAEATGQTLATVSGLDSGATGANVSYAEKKITLKKDALGKESTGMQFTLATGITGYTLALDGATQEGKVGFEAHNAWELAGTGNAKYRTGTEEGWTLSDNTVTYTPANITDVVTISGLSDDIKVNEGKLGTNTNGAFVEGVTFGTGDDNKKITLVEAVLGKSEAKDITLTDSKSAGYTLLLASGIKKEAELTEQKLDFTGSTPTVTGTIDEYWTVADDSKSISYKAKTTPTLATISGLGSAASTTGNVTAAFASDKLIVTVKEAALGTSTVTLKPRTAEQVGISAFSAEFNLIKNDGSAIADNKVGLDDGDKYWAYQGTTAYYRYDTTAGFTFDKSNEPLEITYTAAETTTLAKITNLTTNLSSLYNKAEPEEKDNNGNVTKAAVSASITGINVTSEQPITEGGTTTSGVITLDKDVLGTTAGSENATTLTGDGYILALATGVPKEAQTDVKVWTFGTNNATLTSSNPAYWTIETGATPKTITYTAESNQKNLATVTGLNTLTGDTLENNITVTNPKTEGEPAVTTPGTIALGKDALGTKNVTLTNGVDGNFKLALITETEYAATALNPTEVAWSINGTTATYSGEVTAAGYEVKTDGSEIVYTPKSAEGQKTTLATIKGLKSGLTTASADTYFKFGSGDKAKEITVSKDALGASNISVTGTNYTLALPADGVKKGEYTAATNTTPATTTYSDTEDVWRLKDSTTAVYKKVTPAYYTLNTTDNTSIIYTAEATEKVNKGTAESPDWKDAIYATVSGLKNGVVEKDGQIGTNTGESGAFVQGIKLGTVSAEATPAFTAATSENIDSADAIELSAAVLGTNDVTVTNGDAADSKKYKFALATGVTGQQGNGTKTWTGGNGTFKYVGALTEGWTLDKQNTSDTVDNKITYAAAEGAHEFATVKGLSSDVTAAALNDASTGSNYLTVNSVDNVITLKAKALGGEDISVTGSDGYTLALDSTNIRKEPSTANIWSVATDGTTYTYKNVNQDFYAYDKKKNDQNKDVDDNTKIKYTAQSDVSGGTIATFAGLKSGLLNADGTMPDTAIALASQKFTVTAAALDEKDVTISNLNTDYSVEGDFGADNLKPGTAYWDLDGTTARYQHDVTAGYTLENVANDATKKTIKYADETTVVEAEIAGLKSGLKVSGGAIDGISIENGSTEFKLDASKVLTTTSATLTNKGKTSDGSDAAYTLALDSYTKPANGTAWVVKGTTATLVNYAPAFYAAKDSSNNKEIVYTKAKVGTADYSSTMTIPAKQTLATIEGLKSGLKPNENGQIDGLTVTANTNVTLSKNVLGTTNVKITKGDADSGTIETLALDSTGDANHKVYAPIESGKWSVKNGVPTYTSTTAAGYNIDTTADTDTKKTNGQVIYSPQKVIKVTVNGLDKVATNTAGDKVGKKSGDNYYGINLDRTSSGLGITSNAASGATEKLAIKLTLGKDVLNKKNVTVSTSGGTADVTFELDTGVAATTSAAVWNKAKGKTVATYTETTAAGYSLPTDNKKVIYSSKATTKTLATVTGLKKDLVATNGELLGVTVTKTPSTETKQVNGVSTIVDVPGEITLTKDVLNTSKITLGKNDNYELALASDYASTAADVNQVWTYNKSKGTATVRVGTTEGWAIKQTTQKVNNVDTLITDPKTIVYTAAKYTNIATISGLSKKLTLTDGHIEGLDVNVTEVTPPATPSPNVAETGSSAEAETPKKYKGTISITSDVLNNATVKVEVPTAQQSIYSFKFSYDVNDIKAPTDSTNYWRGTGNGTVTYQFDTSAGYTPNNVADPTVLTYSKAKTTVHATLSGLDKKVGAYNTVATKDSKGKPLTYSDPAELPGIEVTLAQAAVADNPTTTGVNEAKEAVPGKITLKASAVIITPTAVSGNFTNKVTLKKGKVGDYNLNIDEIDVEEAGAKWTASGTTATYKDYDAAGYTLDTKTKKTATFVKETAKATLATVKGIKKLDAAAATAFNANPATYVSVEGDKITLTSEAVGTSTISLTQGKDRDKKVTTYYFDTNVSTSINPRDAQTPYWTFSKGTATLKQLTKDGYTPNDDTKPTKFVYSKDTTATLATVKGLSTTLAVPTAEQIEATKNDSNKLENIKLYATKDSGTKDSKGKAIYVPNAENVVATYDATAKTITLNKDAFNKKTVTVTVPKNSDQYTLKLGTDLGDFANYTRNTTGWTVSGTTATYRNYNQLFYTPATDGKSIVYTAETKGTTYATVTGLKKDIDASILNEIGVWTNPTDPTDGGTLTLDARHLGTATVKLTTNLTNTKNKDSFALALSTNNDTDKKVTTSTLTANSSSVTADNGKAIIKGKVSEGFAVEFGGKQITYTNANAAKKDVTIATVTGLKKAASINVDSSTGQITLDSDDLTTKNVSVVTSKGNTTYTLIYSGTTPGTDATNSSPAGTEAAPNNPSKKTPGWTISKNTGTLKGYVTQEGFTKSESGTSLTYTAKTLVNEKTDKEGNKTYTYKDTATLATIKGLNNSAGLTAPTSGTISLSKNDIKGSSVTINGGTFAVSIDSSYKDKTINGSAGADNITAEGTGLTINTGKGDDNITLGTSTSRTKGNTLVYSTGDGNDVVANFIAGTDKLQIKKGTATVEKVGSDFIVRVGTGSIKLTGAASSAATSLAIVNSSGTEVTYSSIPETSTGGTPLLVDDNYFTDPTQISEIVKPFEASFTPYEFKTNFNLTKEESFVPTATYTNKK